jgi:hypothetical protein
VADDVHLFAYVSGQPSRYIDPFGLSKIRNDSCVQVYIKAEGDSRLILLNPGETGDGDGVYNVTPGSCAGFCNRGGTPAPEVYKINDATDISIGGGCNASCLEISSSGPISWTAHIMDPRTGWQGDEFFSKHPDWPKPTASTHTLLCFEKVAIVGVTFGYVRNTRYPYTFVAWGSTRRSSVLVAAEAP